MSRVHILQKNQELKTTNTSLSNQINERKKAQAEREALYQQLMQASRQAGMADVASSVLHNVGNALNSVKVTAGVLAEVVQGQRLEGIQKAVELAATHVGDGLVGTPPPWMLDGDFAVQVLMWNPEVFPGQPEQYTGGLAVYVGLDGSVATRPYGTAVGGLDIWHEVTTNKAGQRLIRFPFSIPGM